MKTTIVNWCQAFISVLAGVCSILFGGWDAPIILLIVLICMDMTTGVIKAIKKKQFASLVARWGFVTKFCELACVALFVLIDNALGTAPWLRNIACVWFILCELASVLENLNHIGVMLPEGLINILVQAKQGFGISISRIIKKVLQEYLGKLIKENEKVTEEGADSSGKGYNEAEARASEDHT